MSSLRRFLIVAVFSLVVASSAYSQNNVPKDLKIDFERTACFGWCPNYSITITADGRVEFYPLGTAVYRGKGVAPSAPLQGNISSERLNHLLAELRKINFFSLRKRYGQENQKRGSPATCPDYRTDASTVIIWVAQKGRRKVVRHYLGCRGARILDDLTALEYKIDEITNTEQWTSQYAWGTGNVIDLKIEVNHSISTTTKKPQN